MDHLDRLVVGGCLVVVMACGASVAGSVETAFTTCMEDAGHEVEGVEVEVTDDGHIEGFAWTSVGGGSDAEAMAQQCLDDALRRFDVSRT